VNGPHAVDFNQLAGADLVLERVYRGGIAGNTGDDPLSRLLPVGNQGGFRAYGSPMNLDPPTILFGIRGLACKDAL